MSIRVLFGRFVLSISNFLLFLISMSSSGLSYCSPVWLYSYFLTLEHRLLFHRLSLWLLEGSRVTLSMRTMPAPRATTTKVDGVQLISASHQKWQKQIEKGDRQNEDKSSGILLTYLYGKAWRCNALATSTSCNIRELPRMINGRSNTIRQ